MAQNRRKLITTLLNTLNKMPLHSAVESMWERGLLNEPAVERLYITHEVSRRVRNGEAKVRAIEQLSEELGCSYEKVRGAVYSKN